MRGSVALPARAPGAAARVLAGMAPGVWRLALLLALCLALAPARAHDTTLLVERAEPRRLRLVLVLDPVQSLNQWLAPELGPASFLAAYVRKAPSEFKRELQSLQLAIERGVRLEGADGRALRLSAWDWPDAAQWQGWLRERMQRWLAAGSGMAPDGPTIEIHAQASSPRPLGRVRLSLPALMHPTLVVHPPGDQFWIGALSPMAYLDP